MDSLEKELRVVSLDAGDLSWEGGGDTDLDLDLAFEVGAGHTRHGVQA